MLVAGGFTLSIQGRRCAVCPTDLRPKTARLNNILYTIALILNAQRTVQNLVVACVSIRL